MSDSNLTEEQARQLWARASQLQEDARRRAEEAARVLPVPVEHDETGFALEHVRQAAVEAGIDARFVDTAWRETQAGVSPAKPRVDRRITRFLGGERRVLEASRSIGAPPAEVLEAVHTVFTGDACKLVLADQVGGHPLEGGSLVFTATADYTTQIGKAIMWSDMREFLVSFQPKAPEGPTVVRLRAPMEHSRKLNYRVGVGLNGVISAGGFGGALALGAGLGLMAPAVAAVGIGGFAATWLATLKGYRWMYKKALAKGELGLNQLLRQVAVHVETRTHRSDRWIPPETSSES